MIYLTSYYMQKNKHANISTRSQQKSIIEWTNPKREKTQDDWIIHIQLTS